MTTIAIEMEFERLFEALSQRERKLNQAVNRKIMKLRWILFNLKRPSTIAPEREKGES